MRTQLTGLCTCGRIVADKIADSDPQTCVAANNDMQFVQPWSFDGVLLHTVQPVSHFLRNKRLKYVCSRNNFQRLQLLS